MITLLALVDAGAPCFHHAIGGAFAAMGIPCFACALDLFPELMAAAFQQVGGDGTLTLTRPLSSD